jgi:hypothetical protein
MGPGGPPMGGWGGNRSGGGGFGRFGGHGEGGDRFSRMEGFLRTMDTNGDGVIQESEVPEERRGMLRFLSTRFGLDPAQGLSIDKLREAINQRGHDHGGQQPSSPQSPTPDQKNAQPQTPPKEQPLVPGFGLDRQLPPAAGFGSRLVPTGRVDLGIPLNIDPQARWFFDRFDRNHSGALEREEWQNLPINAADIDSNHDGIVSLAEVAARFPRKQSAPGTPGAGSQFSGPPGMGYGFGGGFGGGPSFQGGAGGEERSDDHTPTEQARRGSYRFLSPGERLPKGLPSWFAERDTNHDGQVSMAEFSGYWTPASVEDYLKYDGNRDGLITPEECLRPGGGAPTAPTPQGPSSAQPSGSPASGGGESPWWLQ